MTEPDELQARAAPVGAREEPPSTVFPRIDGYQIVGLLGRGATGVVYSAIQLAVDRPVALKVLHPELSAAKRPHLGESQTIRRLQREARTAARLAHPSIIGAIDMGEQDGRWWFAMELVEGISLAERLEERGPMSERDALRFFIPLCDGLRHSAEQGVVHRDIKPANILIDAQGRARLADLGLAFAEDDPLLTRAGGTLGTPHYISPEQAREASSADAQSDIWSLGATMFHAVCGRPPFEGSSVAEILTGVLQGRVPDPRQLAPELSRGFALVLRKCLTRDRARRYRDPAELMHDLERIRERRAPAVDVAALDPVGGSALGPRLALAGGTALVAGLAALGAWVVGSSPRDSPGERPSGPWPELVALEQSVENGALNVAAAYAELAELESVPEGWGVRRRVLETRLGERLDQELARLRDLAREDLDALLAARRFPSARELVDGGVERALREATGFVGGDLPGPRAREFASWREGLQQRLDEAERGAMTRAAEQLERHVALVVEPRFEELVAAQRWRSALALLQPERGWWAEAGLAELGVGEEPRRLALGPLEGRLAALEARCLASYAEREAALAGFLEGERARLEQGLVLGEVVGGAQRLRAAYEEERERLGIDPREVPRVPRAGAAAASSDDALEAACGELARAEERALAERALRLFESDARQADALCADRMYAEAIAFWDSRQSERWRSAAQEAMRQRAAEARLGAEVLERAVERLRWRAERGELLTLTFDNLAYRDARVELSEDVPRDGFVLRPKLVKPFTVHLVRRPELGPDARVLRTRDLLALADLVRVDLSTRDQFLLGLFLHYEGSHEEALQALPASGGSFPERGLQPDLERRIRSAIDRSQGRLQARLAELDDRLYALERLREQGGTPKRLLADIAEIFATCDDVLDASRRRMLEELRLKLEHPEESEPFEAAYLPDALDFLKDGVRLHWSFPPGRAGAWVLGDLWSGQEQGLSLLTEATDEAALWSSARELALPLRAPLELRGDLALELELELGPRERGMALVLELAGVGLALVDEPGQARVAVDVLGEQGGARALVERVRRAADKAVVPFQGLPRGRSFVLALTCNPRAGGRVELEIDGLVVAGLADLPRPLVPRDARLVLRSGGELRVRRAVLEGQRQR